MAKNSAIQGNLNVKKKVKTLSNKRKALKSRIYDKNTPLEERFDLVMQLASLPRSSSRTRVRNRCALTGRPRGYYRKFDLSRIQLRDIAGEGGIPGLIKSSW